MSELAISLRQLDEAFPTYTRELTAHCYKMVGSVSDAEDLVQETYLRARRGIKGFAGRSALRTWLYRIATNTCLSAMHPRHRRVLPSGLGAPSDDPEAPLRPDPGVDWLEPLPGRRVSETDASADPGEIVVARDTLRIALVAALQHLAPRQRAALLLREVLAWSAAEIAETLGVSEPAVKSLLQRGRQRLAELDASFDDVQEPVDDDVRRDLLDRYIAAFEASDVDALAAVIDDDFSIEATPCRTWFKGMAVCLPHYERRVFETADLWRLLPTTVNGQTAVALYRHEPSPGAPSDETRDFLPVGVSVLTMRGARITRVHDFIDPRWVVAAGLPERLAVPVART